MDKLDERFIIIEIIITAGEPFTMIYDTGFFIAFETIQKGFFSVALCKQSESVWLAF